jgi:phosphohistidine phosphatase
VKTLLILRHAKSSWSDASLSDHDRPLKKRGRQDAPKMGKLLYREGLTPGLIVTSSARRAVETAQFVAAESGYEGGIVVSGELYHADPESYLTAVRECGEGHDIVMLIGHNPGIEDLVEQLAGEWQRMPTAALAQVRLDVEAWPALRDDATGRLVNLWLAREVEP